MCFLIKNIFDDDNKIIFILLIIFDFLCQIEILLMKTLKLLKIPGFSRLFLPKLSNSRFFQVKWQPCQELKHQDKNITSAI